MARILEITEGGADFVFDPREAWPLYASNVVRYVVVPAGHYPQEQAPEEVYAALDQFFRE